MIITDQINLDQIADFIMALDLSDEGKEELLIYFLHLVNLYG